MNIEKAIPYFHDYTAELYLEVFIQEKPENNQANIALIKQLSKYFGIQKSEIKILSGHKSKIKKIKLDTSKKLNIS